MYRPPHFQPAHEDDALAAIAAWPLAALVTGGLDATHLPMIRDGDTLIGHVARANPHWQRVQDGADALAIFTGPSAYVSPGFYSSKAEHGRVVPTWNYVAIHVHGAIAWIDDPAAKFAIVRALTDHFERSETKPWSVDDAPASYIDAMLRGIVGLRLRIDRIESQFKLSQNRTEDDRSGTELGLDARSDADSKAIAALMRPQGRPPSG